MNETADPLVSVVIPTFNHASYLARALQSVLDQTYTNWEAIVIDNHSTDNTDDVMASFADSRINLFKIHNNGVIAASRNVGIRAAKCEWIAFLDSDDWWTVDKLQVCFDCINDKVDLVYHDLKIVSDQPKLFGRKINKSRQVKPPVFMDLLLKGNAINNSSVVVRKSLVQLIGDINENVEMIASEDYNTWLRIAQLTEQFVYLPRRLGYYMTHNQGISKKEMSVSCRCAVAEFVSELSASQKLKLEATFRYTKGRFNYLMGNYAGVKEDLLFVIKHGRVFLRIKALTMMAMRAHCNWTNTTRKAN